MPHRYTKYMGRFTQLIQESKDKSAACPGIDESQMEIWPDDADEEEMAALWELVGRERAGPSGNSKKKVEDTHET